MSGYQMRAGDIIDGRWELVRKLGEGGMGQVWEAEHIALHRKAAIKIMQPDMADSERYREQFITEAQVSKVVAEQTRHPGHRSPGHRSPGAADVYDLWTIDGQPGSAPYAVMELLDGASLEQMRKRSAIKPKTLANITENVLKTLETMHALGFVHRDIKPDNIFVERNGDVRLIDYGLASFPGSPPSVPGYLLGTPGAASPEQGMGVPEVDDRSDVYGVAANAYWVATQGRRSLPTSNVHSGMQYLEALGPDAYRAFEPGALDDPGFAVGYPGCPVPPIQSVAPGIPDGFARVIDKGMQCTPANRYQSATEMRADLERAIREEMVR